MPRNPRDPTFFSTPRLYHLAGDCTYSMQNFKFQAKSQHFSHLNSRNCSSMGPYLNDVQTISRFFDPPPPLSLSHSHISSVLLSAFWVPPPLQVRTSFKYRPHGKNPPGSLASLQVSLADCCKRERGPDRLPAAS